MGRNPEGSIDPICDMNRKPLPSLTPLVGRFSPSAYWKPAPWKVTSDDVDVWLEKLQERGFADSTITQKLSAISSFYKFVCQFASNGQFLYDRNPVEAVERPQVTAYEKAVYLSPAQIRAFLRMIPRDTIHGLRNYALFLFYVATGRRNTEIRTLQWGDFLIEGETVLYHWNIKDEKSWDACPTSPSRTTSS